MRHLKLPVLAAFAAFLSFAAAAGAAVIDFEAPLVGGGDVVNTQYAAGIPGDPAIGATISVINNINSPNIGVAFDTTLNPATGGDGDLQAPFSSPNFPGLPDGHNPGNILIIQENFDSCTGTPFTHCSDPDDQARVGGVGAGTIFIDLTTAVTVETIDFFDIETGENGTNEDNKILLYGAGNALLATSFVPDTGGNNTWGQVSLFTDNVLRIEIRMRGSGAIDNVVVTKGTNIETPEPAGLALLGTGLLALALIRRQRAATGR